MEVQFRPNEIILTVISYAPAIQNNLRERIIDTAEKKKIPFQRHASSRYTGTDTDAFAYSNGGVASEGKHTVVIGRSDIVGKPISILMGLKTNPGNSTVTLAHSRTKNISDLIKEADIIISALGVPNFVKAEMVKDGAVVIDVGITRVKDDSEKGYKIVGDVDYENVANKSSFITPVPGGVGPMTIAMLLTNTLKAYLQRIN